MNKKQVLRTAVFACVLIVVLYLMCSLFRGSNNLAAKGFNKFYDLEEETVDAIIVGTSGIDRYWIAAKGYEEYGITMYPLATNAQPTWTMLNTIKEAKEQNQDLKLVVVDMRPFTVEYEPGVERPEAFSRQAIDLLPLLSKNRVDAIERTLEHLQMINPDEEYDRLSFYLPFIKFHPKWSEDNFSFKKILNQESDYLGFHMAKHHSTIQTSIDKRTQYTDEVGEITDIAKKNLYDILDYCKEQGYEVLFVNTPHYLGPNNVKKMNAVAAILEEEGVPYLNYTVVDESVYNLEEDYYNDGHVNYYGAEKFTTIFAKYLDENYDLPDRRNDENVKKDWDGVYKKIKDKIADWEEKVGNEHKAN